MDVKVKDITSLINDNKCYIELIKGDSSTYGIMQKGDALLQYSDKIRNAKVKVINTQYRNNKRIIVLVIDA